MKSKIKNLFNKSSRKDINQIKEEFIKIEEEFKIFDEKFASYYYWDFVRTAAFFKIVSELNFYEKASFSKKLDMVGEKSIIMPHISNAMDSESLVVWENISHRHIIPTEKFAEHTNYLILDKGDEIREDIYNMNPKMYYFNFEAASENSKLQYLTQMPKYEEMEIVKQIIQKLAKHFGLTKNAHMALERTTLGSIFHHINKSYQIECLIKDMPELKKIYIILPMYKFFAAAIKNIPDRNIEIIEIQHGIMPSYDIKYSYPQHANLGNTNTPDKLFVNSLYWKDYSGNKYLSKAEVFETPFLSRENKFESNFDENKVLFISQWNITNQLTKLAIDFARKNPNMEVTLRLHPVEEETEVIAKIKKANINNIKISEVTDIYEDLASHKNVVSVVSTVIFQAIENYNNVYIFDIFNNSGFNYFYENNIAFKISNATDLSKSIALNVEINTTEIDRIFKDCFAESQHLL